MPRPARVSPARILDAAAVEFAERGYAGARVDRIARRARVNKAMLYYHFASKQNLYRALLRSTFGQVADELARIGQSDLPPAGRLDAAVTTLAAFIEAHAFFPSIMLREVADGGVHLDPDTLAALAAVPAAFGTILQPGLASGRFVPMHPLAAYFTAIAPILMFVASAPVRKQLVSHRLSAAVEKPLPAELFLADFKAALHRAFAAPNADATVDGPGTPRAPGGVARRAAPASPPSSRTQRRAPRRHAGRRR
jgi:TetR/AcrR family transcriptional regulator